MGTSGVLGRGRSNFQGGYWLGQNKLVVCTVHASIAPGACHISLTASRPQLALPSATIVKKLHLTLREVPDEAFSYLSLSLSAILHCSAPLFHCVGEPDHDWSSRHFHCIAAICNPNCKARVRSMRHVPGPDQDHRDPSPWEIIRPVGIDIKLHFFHSTYSHSYSSSFPPS